MLVWSLSREGLLEKEMATHSSILSWEIPWSEESGGLQSMGSQRVGRDLGAKSQQHVVYILKSYNWKKAKSEEKTKAQRWILMFSRLVVSNSLPPHGLQYARLPCHSLSPGACSNTCPLSQWCRPTISSSVIPFSYLRSFTAAGSFYWISSPPQVAKVLELQLQRQSFQWIFRVDFL